MTPSVLLPAVLLLCSNALAELCDADNGLTNIILDIDESRGSGTSQETTPKELPVVGDPFTEVELSLVFPKGQPSFILNGRKLQLLKPLDRDAENLSHVVFQLTCQVRGSGRKRSIPVIVRVNDINDNAPAFVNTPYETSVSEVSPVGSTVYQGLKAVDADSGVNGLVEYRVVEGVVDDPEGRTQDGSQHFAINLPHQGQVTVARPLDFERTQRYLLTVVATDRARTGERFSATTTLTIQVKDDDDQDPSFIYQGCMLLKGSCVNPEYHAQVSSGVLSGVLSVSPEKIQAVDMDSLNAPIAYSLLSGTPASFGQYFQIHPGTGAVTQVKPVDSAVAKRFELIVKAEEGTEAHRYATAKLVITVKPVDSSPPQISASASEGMVDENAPLGTKVLDSNGKPIKFNVSDPDIGPEDPKPDYSFELTTTFFNIDSEGLLVVGDEKLDRDPPSPGVFRFQVVAREKQGTGASAPLTMMVGLNDVNDNAPRLPMIPAISVQAGEGQRQIVKVTATDNDLGENAEITYSIYHVSNTGMSKFKIDPKTGVIDSVAKLTAKEQYSITVQATDSGGKHSQTIVEVNVVPGPNTRSPMFAQNVYEVTVSEGAAINSTVATITAIDPENEPVSYSIISGNDLRQFGINDKTGVISVIRKLDREDLNRYQLLIKAEDEGGLSNSATVNIQVSDINDKNPEFSGLPYEWRVKEGLVGAHIGKVRATDADYGANANVSYSLPGDVPFTINPVTGDVMTSTALDYEQHKEYKFIVTAQDGAPDPRLATATVTVHVDDTEDELPTFAQTSYHAKVLENLPDYVITQVKADDPDTTKRVTYVIKQGSTEYFAIDPKNGKIKTLKGLDYETENQHELVVATEENNSTRPGATAKVIIDVEDRNDIPPVFLTVPRPITLDDDVAIGSKVTTLQATDSDGTPPGNRVRYEVIGRNKAPKLFQIDPELGTITVRDDLRKETETEYQVDVRAYDLGEPQLSSVTSVPVFVRRVATVPPDVGVGFAEDAYTVQLPEDSVPGTLLKRFNVINTRGHHQSVPLRCSITQGNEQGLFVTNTTGERDCELRLGEKRLDYEKKAEYQIKLQLDTIAGLVSPSKSSATIKIQVEDVNDNGPLFIFPSRGKLFRKEKYFGGVSKDKKEIGATVVKVQAKDKDSGKLGSLEYNIVSDSEGKSDYFTIDPLSGLIKTKKSLDGLDGPIKFLVRVIDNPFGPSNEATAEVVVNLIEENNRLIMELEGASPDQVTEEEEAIVSAVEAASGLIMGVERVLPLERLSDNQTVLVDKKGTDLWVYFVDRDSETILQRNDSAVNKSVLNEVSISNISTALSEVTPVAPQLLSIHAPVPPSPPLRTAVVAFQWDAFPFAVILIAALILVLGMAGIIYICISWSRYKAYKERMQRMYVMPRYDPVFVEPNLKEYETQVLQMSVPMDDSDSYHDLQIDFSHKNHAFSLDSVSYITKDQGNGQQSPASSDAATTFRASSIGRHNNINNNNIMEARDGTVNPVYERSDDELGHSASPTNENVTFRGKKDYSHIGFNYLMEPSPIEATTEL